MKKKQSESEQKSIVADIAATAQMPATTETTTKIVKALPGLVGAVDRAIFDIAGKPLTFVLVIFSEGQAMHATNGDHAQVMAALKEVVG